MIFSDHKAYKNMSLSNQHTQSMVNLRRTKDNIYRETTQNLIYKGKKTGIKPTDDHNIFTMGEDKKVWRKIPFKRVFSREKLYYKGKRQSGFHQKVSLSKTKNSTELPKLNKYKSERRIGKAHHEEENAEDNIISLLKREEEEVDTGSLKHRLVRKEVRGKIYLKNKEYDEEQEKNIGRILKRLGNTNFVKNVLRHKFDKFMDKKRAKGRLLQSWKLRSEIINYEKDKREVNQLESWLKEQKM